MFKDTGSLLNKESYGWNERAIQQNGWRKYWGKTSLKSENKKNIVK